MNRHPEPVSAQDLWVVLEKAYRKRTRQCGKCGFTIPFAVFRGEDGDAGSWAVEPSETCTPECRNTLDELVSTFQKKYRLEGSGRPGLM